MMRHAYVKHIVVCKRRAGLDMQTVRIEHFDRIDWTISPPGLSGTTSGWPIRGSQGFKDATRQGSCLFDPRIRSQAPSSGGRSFSVQRAHRKNLYAKSRFATKTRFCEFSEGNEWGLLEMRFYYATSCAQTVYL